MARPRKSGITEAALADLYITQGLSQSQIASRFGVTQGAVWYYMKQFRIPARPSAESNPKEILMDEAELRKLYCVERMTIADIARKLECSYSTVRNNLMGMGVDLYKKGFRKRFIPSAMRDGTTVDRGYAQTRVVDHPYAKKRGRYVYAHRLAVEKFVGRYLTPDEHVHHINVVRADRNIENLAVLNSSQHARVHKHMCHVAAYLLGLTSIRPEPLDFGEPVFWGGQYITSLDLIGEAESAGRLRMLKPAEAQPAATVN